MKNRKEELEKLIRNLDFRSMNILQIQVKLETESYSLNEISNALTKVKSESKSNSDYNNFGSCGINRDANPCGDASDY